MQDTPCDCWVDYSYDLGIRTHKNKLDSGHYSYSLGVVISVSQVTACAAVFISSISNVASELCRKMTSILLILLTNLRLVEVFLKRERKSQRCTILVWITEKIKDVLWFWGLEWDYSLCKIYSPCCHCLIHQLNRIFPQLPQLPFPCKQQHTFAVKAVFDGCLFLYRNLCCWAVYNITVISLVTQCVVLRCSVHAHL